MLSWKWRPFFHSLNVSNQGGNNMTLMNNIVQEICMWISELLKTGI